MTEQPQNLKDINDNLITYLNIFVVDNWKGVPVDFIETVSKFIDTLILNESFISGSKFSEHFIDVDLGQVKGSKDTSKILEAMTLYTEKEKISKYVENKNNLRNADFYDKNAKKISKFIKSLKNIDIEMMRPNEKQSSDYLGYIPKDSFFNFNGIIRNEYVQYKLSQSGVSYAETLARSIFSYKLALFADVQYIKLKEISQHFNTPKKDSEIEDILEKTLVF